MRLIDADELVKNMQEAYEYANELTHFGFAKSFILKAPTVRHEGEWVSKGDVYPAWKYCSKCGEPWTFDCGTPKYCPNCGAEMEE